MRFRDRSLAFQVAALGGAAAPADPLSALDDNFIGGSSNMATRGWSTYKPAALAGAVVDTALGTMTLSIVAGSTGATGSFWFDNADGVLLYKDVTGNCQMTARITAQNAAGSGNPGTSSYRLAGIAAHDPASISGNRNYEHAAIGTVNGVAQSNEWKDTRASVSLFGGSSIASSTAWVRLTRVGQVFTMATSLDGVAFTDYHTINRATSGPSMPSTMRWGMMVYAVLASHDIRGVYRDIRFRTP